MKKLIKNVLSLFGLELRKIPVRQATMIESLCWLSKHNFKPESIIDVGASNGSWSKLCMRYFPNATYILYEPQPVHFEALDMMIQNTNKKIFPVKKAVGAATGFTYFDASDPFGGALMKESGKNSLEVEVTTIDKSISELNIKGPFLLKLDTHGFEKGILDGSAETLKHCDILIIEAYNYRIAEDALLFWELCAYLHQKGFRPIDLVDVLHRQYDNSFWQIDLVFVRSSWQGFDYISFK